MTFRFYLKKFFLVIAGVSAGVGVGVGAFQAYYWLWYGVYVNISALDAFVYVDEHIISMGRLPGEGFRILEAVPLALVLIILGLLLLLVSFFLVQFEKYSQALN
jgi:hypothetical protein